MGLWVFLWIFGADGGGHGGIRAGGHFSCHAGPKFSRIRWASVERDLGIFGDAIGFVLVAGSSHGEGDGGSADFRNFVIPGAGILLLVVVLFFLSRPRVGDRGESY